MGTTFGFSEEDRTRDFPELNKCPDCETFFADDCCPLCGKVCPQEFRAGNRKPVKQKKVKRGSGNNGRVIFVPWYFSTPFIIAMLVIQPIIGLILTWMGYWEKKWKITATAVSIGVRVIPVLLSFAVILFGGFLSDFPVDTSMTEAEYKAACSPADIEEIWRYGDDHYGEFYTLTLTVEERLPTDDSADVYYLCHAEAKGKEWKFLIGDYRQENIVNFHTGDVITVWGQCAGETHIYSGGMHYSEPCVNILYAQRIE